MTAVMTWYGVDLNWAYADLLRAIRRRTGCMHRSYDVLHDSLIRLALANQHGAIEEPRIYLRKIVRHTLIDQFHDSSRWVGLPEQEIPTELAPSAESLTYLRQRLEAMQRILNCLPPRCREVFWLIRVEGYTYREIAAQMGISLRVVERQIARALLVICKARDDLRHEQA